jgi:hypothetical protein
MSQPEHSLLTPPVGTAMHVADNISGVPIPKHPQAKPSPCAIPGHHALCADAGNLRSCDDLMGILEIGGLSFAKPWRNQAKNNFYQRGRA